MIDLAFQLMAIGAAMLSGVFGGSGVAFVLLVLISAAFLILLALAALEQLAGVIADRCRAACALVVNIPRAMRAFRAEVRRINAAFAS